MLEKIFELKKIPYRQRLFTAINEHLTQKGDEYIFTSEMISQLWKNELGPSYSDFLEIFEPSIQYISATTVKKGGRIYRDHYIHQLQVFLLGLPIIDRNYSFFKKYYSHPELTWLIASSFHDNAYPVQLFDGWSKDFFKKVFRIERDIGTFELKSNFIDENFLCCMGYLICSFCCTHPPKDTPKGNWLASRNDLVQFFYEMITVEKNHGVMSSISLLKMLTSPPLKEDPNTKGKSKNINEKSNRELVTDKFQDFNTALEKIFVPATLAMALHDEKIWSAIIKKKEES